MTKGSQDSGDTPDGKLSSDATSRHVLLCGFMASGKSAIGRQLARQTGRPFRDLDRYITENEGVRIPDIFKTYGEARFRELERKWLEQLLRSAPHVIALGGGTLQDQHMVERIKANGVLVFLDPPMKLILERLRRDTGRPMLYRSDGTPRADEELEEFVGELFNKRKKHYLQAELHIRIQQGQRPAEVAATIAEQTGIHGPKY